MLGQCGNHGFLEDSEHQRMYSLISEYCLPKLVCELYARDPESIAFTDSEKSLMYLIG